MPYKNLTLILLLSPVILEAADYSKCARFFNNPPDTNADGYTYSVYRAGAFVPNRFRSVPISITASGSVRIDDSESVISQDTSADGRTTTITYKSPPIEKLENLGLSALEIEKHRSEETPGRIIVKRESRNGEIVEIIEELSGESTAQNDLFSSVIGTQTTFEIRNNQCVPRTRADILGRSGGVRTRAGVFATKVCRSFFNLGSEYHKAWSAPFDGPLNEKVAEIFLENESNLLLPKTADYESFYTQDQANDFANRHGKFKLENNDLARLSLLAYVAKKRDKTAQQQAGLSPMIAAQMILYTCINDAEVASFMMDDSLWEE